MTTSVTQDDEVEDSPETMVTTVTADEAWGISDAKSSALKDEDEK